MPVQGSLRRSRKEAGNMERIDSSSNARIKEWAKLLRKKERDLTGRFLAEGDHLIREAMEEGLVEVLISDHAEDYDFEPKILVPEHVVGKLSASVSGAHSVAVCRQKNAVPEKTDRILILDGIQDPGNLGTLIRTAVSFRYDAVVCSMETVDLYNDKVIRSTQGSLFRIPVIRTDLEEYTASLQRAGVCVIATTLDNALPLKELQVPERFAVILGNEGNGVRRSLQDAADVRVRIEMTGFESLNVAVAGGIMMYELRARVK